MEKKSKVLLWVFGLLIVGSVAVTYWKIMVKRDYVVEAQTDCDPYAEECFIWECDPDSIVEGEACTGDAEADVWYFKVAKRNASRIPLCDPATDETCDPWTCETDETDCEESFCTEDQLEAQYASGCVDPAAYAEENPVEEEMVECEEGDEECLAESDAEIICEEGEEACLVVGGEEAACAEGDEACVTAEAVEEDAMEGVTVEEADVEDESVDPAAGVTE